jgi:NAD-dependent deacetylase sirtuin 2
MSEARDNVGAADPSNEPTSSVEKPAILSEETDKNSADKNGNEKNKDKNLNDATTLPSLINRFVHSFESALNSLAPEDESVKQQLPSLDIEGIATYIKTKNPTNVLFMVGAGISTSAGILDFRTPKTGLYDNLAKYDLPDPHAIFDIDFFKQNPEPFFTLARELFPEKLKPTVCHYFMRLMDEKGLLKRCYTQNIDSLEYIAGIRSDKVVTAHGSHHTSTCQNQKCKKAYDLKWIMERLRDKDNVVPKCPSCKKGVVKPDIIFFGERLPLRFFTCSVKDFPKCDLLIIMGTSLVVQPFAQMVQEVAGDTPRLLINLTPAGKIGQAEKKAGRSGLCYGENDNVRDVFYQSTCDDGALRLAELLGWKEELEALVQSEHAKIDAEKALADLQTA